jgi:hypothetical protein
MNEVSAYEAFNQVDLIGVTRAAWHMTRYLEVT